MLVYYFVLFIVSNHYLLLWVSNGHNSVTVQNRTHVYMSFFDHKDLGNHLLQLCPKVVKHPVLLSVACPAMPYFSTSSHKQYDIWQMLFNIKCVICTLLRFYAAQNGNAVPTFWDNVPIPSLRIKQSKCVFWFSLLLLYETFLILRRIQQHIIINAH